MQNHFANLNNGTRQITANYRTVCFRDADMKKYAEILLLQLDPGRVKLTRGNLK